MWLSRDPAGVPNVDNLYGYVANDPIGTNDPLGLWKITATGSLNAVAGAMLLLGPGPFW